MYHEKIIGNDTAVKEMEELIQKENAKSDEPQQADVYADVEDLGCIPIGVEEAMHDFKGLDAKETEVNVCEEIKSLNEDQKRVFDDFVIAPDTKDDDADTKAEPKNEAVKSDEVSVKRVLVTGEGGTGKSRLIRTLRHAIKAKYNKDVVVLAPTGIAAYNVDGMTIHRFFQLPVEHGHTPKYKQLSDKALKFIREQLKNVYLIIIDEVSMISNVTLLYIHLRLVEIFNTSDDDNGWFGKKHILFFGDLIQLPPVNADHIFVNLSESDIDKYLGSLGSFELWRLFQYDELRINMRQQNDNTFRDIQARIRIGIVTDDDIKVLEARKLKFSSDTYNGRIDEICYFLTQSSENIVCLLPTCALCDSLNTAMLNRIESDQIELLANDTISTRVHSLRNKVNKMLSNDNGDISRTAGLAKVITIKIGAQVMIRRNIDTSIGLVNGSICKVISVISNNGHVDKIVVELSTGIQYSIERSLVNFEIIQGVYVSRQQFPLVLSYAITIHKSQGLSLENALIDVGNSVFTCGQVYVALSRVTTLKGLHLINFDPHSVQADNKAIIEYNRLRKLFRPELLPYNVTDKRAQKVKDLIWSMPKRLLDIQEQNIADIPNHLWDVKPYNTDQTSLYSYANVTIQCLLHSALVRKQIMKISDHVLKDMLQNYNSHSIKD